MKTHIKYILLLVIVLIAVSCRTTKFIDSWKSDDAAHFQTNKILIIAITSNEIARQQFETQLAKEYELRGIEAVASFNQSNPLFTSSLKTEFELEEIKGKLVELGFDSIILTKIIGVEERVSLTKVYNDYQNTYRNFSTEYYLNQQIYHDVEHYDKYKVYHVETQLYCMCPTKDKSLIWKGYFDLYAPTSVDKTVKSYIKKIVSELEDNQLLNEKNIN